MVGACGCFGGPFLLEESITGPGDGSGLSEEVIKVEGVPCLTYSLRCVSLISIGSIGITYGALWIEEILVG